MSGAKALYNILKGFFFGWVRSVLRDGGNDSKSRYGFDIADSGHCKVYQVEAAQCDSDWGACFAATKCKGTSAQPG